MPPLDISGHRFGRLIAIAFARKDGRRHMWLCICDCGKQSEVRKENLRSGNTTSCGCHKRRCLDSTTHGYAAGKKSLLYRVWSSMLERCRNPNNRSYADYGGRGITVCERWHKFENFLADMGERPSDKHSIDRVDNDGDYAPSNCKWSTKMEQRHNRRDTKSGSNSAADTQDAEAA